MIRSSSNLIPYLRIILDARITEGCGESPAAQALVRSTIEIVDLGVLPLKHDKAGRDAARWKVANLGLPGDQKSRIIQTITEAAGGSGPQSLIGRGLGVAAPGVPRAGLELDNPLAHGMAVLESDLVAASAGADGANGLLDRFY